MNRSLIERALGLAILLLVSWMAPAQEVGTVTGQVTVEGVEDDRATDILVRLEGTDHVTMTGEGGTFCLENVPYGDYSVILSSIFIEPVRETLSVRKPQVRVRYCVRPSDVTLDELMVEGTSAKRRVELSGFSVDVMKPEALSKFTLSTTEILDRLPGVRIRQTGGVGSRMNINVNGMSGNAIRTFINGIPQSNYGGSFSLRSIPSAMIERIEVYKGVVPAYLSEDALGGAINVILKDQAESQLVLSYSGGSFCTHRGNLYGSYDLGRGALLSLATYYNYSKNNYYVWGEGIDIEDSQGNIVERGTRARRFHDAYDDLGTRVALSLHERPWADQFTVTGIFSKGYKEIQHGAKMNRVYGNRHRRSHMLAGEIAYRKSDLLVDGLELDAMLTYTDNTRLLVDTIPDRYDWSGHPIMRPDGTPLQTGFGAEVKSGLTEGPSLQTDRSHALLLRAGVGYTFLEDHTLTARAQVNIFRRDSEDAKMPKHLKAVDQRKWSDKAVYSLSEENSWLDGRLRSTLFVKLFDQRVRAVMALNNPETGKLEDTPIDKRQTFTGFGGSLSLRLLDRLYLHTSLERAIRLPGEVELFGNAAANVTQSADLRPERSNNFNIGFNGGAYRLGPLALTGGATFFIRDTHDMIREGIVMSALADYTFYENIESILTRGFDSELTMRLWDRLTLSGSFSLFVGLFNTKVDKNGMPHSYYGLPLKNEPSQKGNLNATYLLPNLLAEGDYLTLGANLNYVNRFSVDWIIHGDERENKAFVPQQNPLDLSLSYTMPGERFTLSFDAKNVFNQQLFDNFALQKPGRAFYGKLTYTLK